MSEQGRALLDSSRWLTILLLQELLSVGVPLDKILIEQQVGGDEIDCVADISGELALFELKDKEFNLGSAYSFGAKIGIIRPDYSIIASTEHVGGDAKEHFLRAQAARGSREERWARSREDSNDIIYIEGIEHLREGVQALATLIYRGDAQRVLSRVLSVGALNPASMIRGVDQSSS